MKEILFTSKIIKQRNYLGELLHSTKNYDKTNWNLLTTMTDVTIALLKNG